jgi:hypothetical protein
MTQSPPPDPDFDLDRLFGGREPADLSEMINKLGNSLPEKEQLVIINPPTEQQVTIYERLVPMLQAAHHEMSELSKKKPDGIVNALKIRNINRLLIELRKLLENDPCRDFIELLDEETLPQNSDAVLLLSQWQAALMQYQRRYYRSEGNDSSHWITIENPGSYIVREKAEVIPGFRSSGIIILNVIRANGGQEIVSVQVNTVPVAPVDEGDIETVVRTTIGTFKDYPTTMKKAQIIEALHDAADKLEARES